MSFKSGPLPCPETRVCKIPIPIACRRRHGLPGDQIQIGLGNQHDRDFSIWFRAPDKTSRDPLAKRKFSSFEMFCSRLQEHCLSWQMSDLMLDRSQTPVKSSEYFAGRATAMPRRVKKKANARDVSTHLVLQLQSMRAETHRIEKGSLFFGHQLMFLPGRLLPGRTKFITNNVHGSWSFNTNSHSVGPNSDNRNGDIFTDQDPFSRLS